MEAKGGGITEGQQREEHNTGTREHHERGGRQGGKRRSCLGFISPSHDALLGSPSTRLALLMMSFWAANTACDGISIPMSPRATMTPSDSAMICASTVGAVTHVPRAQGPL